MRYANKYCRTEDVWLIRNKEWLVVVNLALFYALNANSESNAIIIAFALFVSQYIPYFLMGYSILGLVLGDKRIRITLSVTLLSASVSALVSWIIGYFAYMPRPFIDSVGYNLLTH